jgi:phosphatidylglycerol lysyltransferase
MNHRKWFIALTLLSLLTGVEADEPQAPTITLPLRRGPFPTYHFVAPSPPKAIVIFGSGDGGWSQIENRLCTFLQQNAFYTVGIDFRKYAATDYDLNILVSDFTVIAAVAATRAGNAGLPIIYAGWSMGAVQAVAASGYVDWRSPIQPAPN